MENITDTKETLLTQYNEALKFFDHWYQPYEEIVGFYRLKIIEKFATGIRRIKKEYASFEESAIFEIHKTYIKFILPCVSYKKKEASESVEDFIVATIKKQGSITRADQIDIERAKEAKRRALERLQDDRFDSARAQAALERALARLQAKK